MASLVATFVTIVAALVLLYVLIKVHIYLTRRTWKPVWEEEAEAKGPPSESDEEHRAWDEIR